MKKYYTIINRQDFNSLYRYGQIQLNANRLIEYKNDNDLETELYNLFTKLPFFEYDEDYILAEFNCETDIYNILYEIFTNGESYPIGFFIPETDKILQYFGHEILIKIENIVNIYLLTTEAQKSLKNKLDNRINFKVVPYKNLSNKIQNFIISQESKRGANIFWNICKIEQEFNELVDFSIISKSMEFRTLGKKSQDIQDDFFVHLLTYERYEFYPKTDVGYLYDCGDIFAFSQGLKSFKTSGFYKFLESNKPNLSNTTLIQIFEFIDTSKEIETFRNKLTIDNLRLYIVASIFLKFKDEIREKETIKETNVGKQIKAIRDNKNFISELNCAIYLIGGFFGYKKFYDDYYDLVGLDIFEKKNK